MGTDGTPIKIGEYEFDLGQVFQAVDAHLGIAAILVLVAFVFWISRKEGLLGHYLNYRKDVMALKIGQQTAREMLRHQRQERAKIEASATRKPPTPPRGRPRTGGRR